MVGLNYLTNLDPTQLATYPGQAHFATDANHTCRECIHWANQRGERTKYGTEPSAVPESGAADDDGYDADPSFGASAAAISSSIPLRRR